jgi:glycosyltransferase involved in cell wall biosynthesis
MCAGVEAKKVSGKPLVVHVHATEFDRTGGEHANPFVYDIEKSGLDAADKVVTVSEYTKEIVSKKYGTPLEKIEVVHNGNSYEEYSVNSEKLQLLENIKKGGDKLVLFLGRITLQKGPDWFLKTAKKVLDIMPNVTFIVTGSGDMEEQMVSEAGDLGISDKIIFTGFLRGEETDAIFRAADLYVMPSVSEPFGLVALESASRGTPVLISKQSGVSEVLKHSLKADFWDTDEMTDKIIAVLENKPLLEDLQKNGRIEASGVTWDKAAEKLVNLYYSLIHKHA